MRCHFCGHLDTQVVDSRANPEATAIRRRRKCPNCEKRFTTYERVELRMPRLVKKDGSRTDFDRDKLLSSMRLALRKRPVATEAVDAAADRIEDKLPENAARIRAYVADAQKRDIRMTQCITDSKGDRSRRPAQQDDPDHYVRVVDRRKQSGKGC